MVACHVVFLLTRVLVREGEGECGGVPEAVLLGADREAPLGLAEAHHVQRQREVLQSGDQIAMLWNILYKEVACFLCFTLWSVGGYLRRSSGC